MTGSYGKGIFVTGTDTDIGKTYVSRLLADTISSRRAVTYFKPVQTGCASGKNGELSAPDFDFVMEGRAVTVSDYKTHVPYRFVPACSPHLAARMAEIEILIENIKDCFNVIDASGVFTVVEGAGGLLVPLNKKEYMLDIIKLLKIPVVLVTSPGLGTLNHTLLTLEILEKAGFPPAGVVFNNACNLETDYIYKDNMNMIRSAAPNAFLEVAFNHKPDKKVMEFCSEITNLPS